jgi:hypothetical protein
VKAPQLKLAALVAAMVLGALPGPARAQHSDAELAKKLQNPVASLISVPIQSNFDFGLGRDDKGFRYLVNVEPVIPIKLSESWNLITRTIVPFIHQDDVTGDGSQGGIGDITPSLFLSPSQPGPLGVIWGAGPVFLLPTASDDRLGSEKFGLGPTALLLRQEHGWTYGILANHIWSVAGDSDRPDISTTFMQPFFSYTTATHTTFGVNTESTYDWEGQQWTVPINLFVSQLVRIGGLPISFTLGGRYYAERPRGGPDWGFRFVVTLLFPEK